MRRREGSELPKPREAEAEAEAEKAEAEPRKPLREPLGSGVPRELPAACQKRRFKVRAYGLLHLRHAEPKRCRASETEKAPLGFA